METCRPTNVVGTPAVRLEDRTLNRVIGLNDSVMNLQANTIRWRRRLNKEDRLARAAGLNKDNLSIDD